MNNKLILLLAWMAVGSFSVFAGEREDKKRKSSAMELEQPQAKRSKRTNIPLAAFQNANNYDLDPQRNAILLTLSQAVETLDFQQEGPRYFRGRPNNNDQQ